MVTDCLPVRGTTDGRRLHPFHQLIRVVRAEAGEVTLRFEIHPRFDYGLTVPRLELLGPRVGIVYGAADGLVVDASFALEQTERGGCDAELQLRAGDEAYVAVTYQLPHELEPMAIDAEVSRSCTRRRTFWRRASSEEPKLAPMNVVRWLNRGRLSAPVGADPRPAHRPLPTVRVACGATDPG